MIKKDTFKSLEEQIGAKIIKAIEEGKEIEFEAGIAGNKVIITVKKKPKSLYPKCPHGVTDMYGDPNCLGCSHSHGLGSDVSCDLHP